MRKLSPEERLERFLARIIWTRYPDACWIYPGTNSSGYPMVWDGERNVQAMRYAYATLREPIPPGHDIDHLCRNRACCNPDHGEIVTHGENVRRGRAPALARERALAMTHCAQGHELTPENTYPRPDGLRRCLQCKRAYARKYDRRRRGVIES